MRLNDQQHTVIELLRILITEEYDSGNLEDCDDVLDLIETILTNDEI